MPGFISSPVLFLLMVVLGLRIILKLQKIICIKRAYCNFIICYSVYILFQACNNLKLAAQIFGEQYQLVKDAIFAEAQKHISNLNDLFNSVTNKLIAAAKDFECETVLTTDVRHKSNLSRRIIHLART